MDEEAIEIDDSPLIQGFSSPDEPFRRTGNALPIFRHTYFLTATDSLILSMGPLGPPPTSMRLTST
ncbi:hypothetical protein CR513_25206, partial [Mucuna pruriens]